MGFFKRLLGGSTVAVDSQPRAAAHSRTTRAVPPPPFVAKSTWLQWPTIAWGSLHSVAGESYRQAELQRVVGSAHTRLVTAQLVREPTNAHDRNAVRVEVGGNHVGYLPRDLARGAHGLIDSLHRSGRPATCRAEITGGVADKAYLGITLHVGNPWVPFVETTPFLDGSRCTIVTVTREQDYQEELESALATYGDASVASDLGVGPNGTIDVHVDGQLVGHLTAKMTERHFPTLEMVHEAGIPVSCRAHLRRDAKGIIQASLRLQTLPG